MPLRRLLRPHFLLPLLTTCLADPAPLAVRNSPASLHSHFVANLLVDPGFEAGGQSWANSSAALRSVDQSRVYDGAAAQRISAASASESAVFQDRSVIAESSYAALGWIATDAMDGGRAILEVLWLATPGLGDSIPAGHLVGTSLIGQLDQTSDWTSFASSITAPVGAVIARFQLRVELEPDDAGTAWFDELSLGGPELVDDTPPTVAITSPLAGDTLTTPTVVSATAFDDGEVAMVQFFVDGVQIGTDLLVPPYEVLLATDTFPTGPLGLTATAHDTAGNSATSESVPVIVFHPDTTPPVVAITSPLNGATVSGVIAVAASAVDEGLVVGVQFQLNGVNLGAEVTASPFQTQLDTRTLPNGAVVLTAAARDTAGNDTVSAPVQVTVFNQPVPPMNIVLILSDDQRANTMAQMPLTQSLLATPGVQFVNGFATTPLCCPARATILTGLYTHNHHVLTEAAPYGAPAFSDVSTIGTWLQGAGYRTALVGKYMNRYDKKLPWPYQPPGWSYWAAFKTTAYYNYRLVENKKEVLYGSATANYSTKVLTSKAVAFINSTPAGQPLFLLYAPFGPHAPATPASADKTLFSTLPKWRPPAFNEADVSDKPSWVKQLPVLTAAQIKTQDNFRLNQLRTLQAVDRGVRDIVNALVNTGRMSNTAIVFASDNGLSWGEHRFLYKNCLYDECIRIPFIVLAPGVSPRVDSSFVSLADLAPTFAQWARVTPPAAVNGQSLVGLLANPGLNWRQELLVEVLATADPASHEGLFSGVRTKRYAYAEYTTGDIELYDMLLDPNQLTNIAGVSSNSTLVGQLHSLVAQLKAQ
jgi:arylsulfatase A-like enzyme